MLSIIDGEWPARDAALRAWLAAENFTADGQQIKRRRRFANINLWGQNRNGTPVALRLPGLRYRLR